MQSHSPGLYAPYKKPSTPNYLWRSTPVHEWHDTPCHNVDGLSGRGLMTSQYGQKGDKPKRRKSRRRHAWTATNSKWCNCASFEPNAVLWTFHTIQPSSYRLQMSQTSGDFGESYAADDVRVSSQSRHVVVWSPWQQSDASSVRWKQEIIQRRLRWT